MLPVCKRLQPAFHGRNQLLLYSTANCGVSEGVQLPQSSQLQSDLYGPAQLLRKPIRYNAIWHFSDCPQQVSLFDGLSIINSCFVEVPLSDQSLLYIEEPLTKKNIAKSSFQAPQIFESFRELHMNLHKEYLLVVKNLERLSGRQLQQLQLMRQDEQEQRLTAKNYNIMEKLIFEQYSQEASIYRELANS